MADDYEFEDAPPLQPCAAAGTPFELRDKNATRGLQNAIEKILNERNEEMFARIQEMQNALIEALRNRPPQPSLPDIAEHEEFLATPRPRTAKKKDTATSSILASTEVETEAEDKGKTQDLRRLMTVEELLKHRGIGQSEMSAPEERRNTSKNSSGSQRGQKVDKDGQNRVQQIDNNERKVKRGSTNSSEAYEEARMVSVRKAESHGKRESASGRVIPEWRRQMIRLENSSIWNIFFTFAIISNCVLIGVQVEYTAANLMEATPEVFFVISTIYAFVFLIELVVNVLAHGKQFFCSSSWAWNYLDLFIVTSSLVELIISLSFTTGESAGTSTSQLRVLRVVRIARLARVVRIIKLVKFLRALRTLIYSILCTMKSLMWALVLVVLIMYVFAILFTDTVTTHLLDNPAPWQGDSQEVILNQLFGSLHKSMHSLFRSISGGLTWNVAAEALASINWFWGYLFTMYVAFNAFAVLNVMTGVFCQSAVESAQRDQEMAIQSVLLNKQRFETALLDLFKQIDEDGSGRITITEFEDHFQDEAVKALLHALELEVTDAWTLFMMLDQDGDHDIDAEEFLDGCMNLKGTAKAIEVAKLKRRIDNITGKLEGMEHEQLRSLATLELLWQRGSNPTPSNPSKDEFSC